MSKELLTMISISTVILLLIMAWCTHIFTCFANGWYGFLIAGAIMPPIGVLHGLYLWFN